jgi:multidrug resistance protein MdtO
MTASAFLVFLRRELAPTPGRGGATLRLTLACLATSIPILTHHIPHGLIAMITIFLITKEDTSTTLLGSILALMGVTLGLGTALLALKISLDIPWLRLCFFAAFLVGGLFLKRVLTIEGLGSAIGLPAALAMILPDVPVVPGIFSPSPEFLVEFVLWCWLCVFVGLSVNLGVQLLLGPDPLTLLEQELGARFRAVEETLRRLGGAPVPSSAAPTASLESLVTAGMSRQVELLKTASLTHAWARQRHEELAAIITLVDRLVTDAEALRTLAPPAGAAAQASLLRVADACARTGRAFAERRLPTSPAGMARTAVADQTSAALPPLADMERALDEMTVVLRVRAPAERSTEDQLHLLVPDAFTNPEYVQFAIKGALSAMICYLLWVGFDYRGIYTSVITCFVVSLSTIGASNQKGLLRFEGAAVGGGMALISLVYLFPNAETIGGFWLVFGAGTAISAWGNFGSPRISYGGYQVGLAFFKGALHDFGPSRNLTVLRDRLNGVALGLIVFGIVEHVLWPARAVDRMRERLADMLRALAGLALVGKGAGSASDVDVRRRLISQQVTDVQGFIESTKFEPGAGSPGDVERLTSDAQIILLVLLAIARDEGGAAARPGLVREATERLGTEVASCLAAAADHLQGKGAPPLIDMVETLSALERSIAAQARLDAGSAEAWRGRLALYRELVAAVKRLAQAEPRQTAGLTNMPSSVRVRPCSSGRG